MYLYNLTLQKATAITNAVHGNFSGTNAQEIIISRGKTLEVLRPDPNTGKMHTLLSTEVFGIICSLMPFRVGGSSKDYIVLGSNSGKIVILQYILQRNVLEIVHQETFDQSSDKPMVPVLHLATEPKGRAIMVGSVEKQKIVFILERGTLTQLNVPSLEPHKINSLVYHMVGIDMGSKNPTFACLEIDYEGADRAAQSTQQSLTFYEIHLETKQVVRKYWETLDEHANFLVSVPGGASGPSGVLIYFENYLVYKNLGDQKDIRCPIPRRLNDIDDPERGIIFVSFATHRTKSLFFFLAQTEQGDIFKVTLETKGGLVTEIKLKYFDTVPVATAMCVLRNGLFFVAAEFGDHYLYQITSLGADDDEAEFSSTLPLEEGDTFIFAPRELRNAVLFDEMESLSPILTGSVADLDGEDTPQLFVACGRGPRSSLRVLRHGVRVSEMSVSELSGTPNGVWTVKRRNDDEYDAYIIVSFSGATLVLSNGETVEVVSDSDFLGSTTTLYCSAMADDTLVQVCPDGIRHIYSYNSVDDWKVPGKKTIVKCAVNQRQVVVVLSSGDLICFEINGNGQLLDYKERKRMDSEVLCMALGSVPPGQQRSRFLAVGLSNSTVYILSLDPNDILNPIFRENLPACAESLCAVSMGCTDDSLYIGLLNGELLRTVLDTNTGHLSDVRKRYLGSRPVKLFRIRLQQQSDAILAISNRSWLSYYHQNRYYLSPLSSESLEYACGFCSELCPEGVVAISENTMRILALEKLGSVFNQTSFPLEYTPRKIVINPETRDLIVVETEHNAYTEETKRQRREQLAEAIREVAGNEERQFAEENAEVFLKEELPESIFSAPKAGQGMWASTIKIMDPLHGTVYKEIRLEQNEAAMSMCLVQFHGHPENQWFLIVGVAKDFQLTSGHCTLGFLDTYRVIADDAKLEFVHRTVVDGVPMVLSPYNGRLLAGIGRILRLYDMGKKKLLRKCESNDIPNHIVDIQTIGKRIFVADARESILMLRYRRVENQLVIFAEDTHPRWITRMSILDHDTVATADKFGNVAILRLPPNVFDDVEEDPTGHKALWDRNLLNSACQKTDTLACFHVGETVTCLQKATLAPGGPESLIYTTLSGTIGVLVPFTSQEDREFFQRFESRMRKENWSVCGRDHVSFRSCYYPVKSVVDGDLCEQFNSLEVDKQKIIAHELKWRVSEVLGKLEDIRTKCAF